MTENGYTLGLVSVSFRGYAPSEILDAAKRAGLECIEWGSDIHAPCTDENALRDIAALQAQYGLFCSSYGTYFRLGQTPLNELETYIAAAKILGTTTLRLWCGTKSGSLMTEDEREHLFDECRQAAAIAERHGVTLCMECHRDTFTEHREDALALMRAVASPHFRLYWQPAQWRCSRDNVEYAWDIAPYTEAIHVFHWRGEQRFPLSSAAAQWREYLTCFPRPRTLLLEFMPNDTLEELNFEAMTLKRIAGGCL